MSGKRNARKRRSFRPGPGRPDGRLDYVHSLIAVRHEVFTRTGTLDHRRMTRLAFGFLPFS